MPLIVVALLALALVLAPQQAAALVAARGPGSGNNSTGILWRPSQAARSTCNPTGFAADPSLDPASWKQCAALYSEWAGKNGVFGVATAPGDASYRALVCEADCALTVAPLAPAMGPYLIGSKDVEALLQRSLNDFSSGSLLAVNGTIDCQVADGGRASMTWRISRPDGGQ